MLCSSHPVIFRVILLLTGVFQACNAAEAESKQQKCMNKTTFVEICTTHLIADPNSDQLSSQREFVSFLDNLAANYSQTNATGPSSFDTSSISFQIPYMYHLCSYMKKQMNTTSNNDCQDILLNSNITSAYNLNISRDNFGFLLTDVQNNDDEKEISSLCSDLFIPSIEAGYINPCAVSIPPVDTSVSPVFPKTGIILAAAGAGLVTAAIFSGLLYRKINNIQKNNENTNEPVEDAVEGL